MSRRSEQNYFTVYEGAPDPLRVTVKRRVRFEEVDPLNIVWHGRYASFLEDGRSGFGENYCLSYLDMYREGFLAPIVQMHIDYHAPLRFPVEFTIEATLHWTEAVRLNFSYRLTGPESNTVATAFTVQLFTSLTGDPLLILPVYIEKLRERWHQGDLS